MSGLRLWCAATICWMVLMSELDARVAWFTVDAGGYALGLAAAALLVVPALRRASATWMIAVTFPAYLAIELLTQGSIEAADVVGGLVQFASGAVTIFLVSRLARHLAIAEEVLTDLAVGPLRETVEPFSRIQGEMFREVRRARRYERPLAMLAVSGSGPQPSAELAGLLEQVRRESLNRYLATRLGSLLDEETAGSTIVAERGDHFLLMLPEAGPQEAEQVAKRLERAAAERIGVTLRCAVASFPHQEITFDKLVETAEAGLREFERLATARGGAEAREASLAPSSSAGS